MADPIAISSIILAVGTMIGGVFGFFHFKLNSNCCTCCKFECSEKTNKTPPTSPLKLESVKKEPSKDESKV